MTIPEKHIQPPITSDDQAMIVTASRPYFAPYAGFFARICRSDVLVILDSVQFPRGTTWITRNRFKNDQGALWMTIPVWKKGLGLQLLGNVRICHDSYLLTKHLQSLKQAYAKAPYLPEHLPFIEHIFSPRIERLIDFNLAILRHLMLHMGIDTEVRLLSELNIRAKGERLLVELCRYFAASSYPAPGAAAKHLDPRLFERDGFELMFYKARPCIYPQLWGDFIPDLSAFDLVFNCGPKSRDIMLASP